MLIDVSIISSNDAGTGIQRVVRSLVLHLLKSPPDGFEVSLVRATRRRTFQYASEYAASLSSGTNISYVGEVHASAGDVYLGLDLTSRISPRRHRDFQKWRAAGVRCAFVVYDLLPFQRPEWFTRRSQRSFRQWLSVLAVHADALFCISSTVAKDTRHMMQRRFALDPAVLPVMWFHLGADRPATREERQMPNGTILMVGTLEPRKGHAQVLDAFEELWHKGVQTRLVIAGRAGWKVDTLVERLARHPEAGRRLQWLSNVDDEELSQLYRQVDGLLMASEAEGFGLPLIEAAQYGTPIFLRDIPVFREIAGAHGCYFTATSGRELAPQLAAWIERLERGSAPRSDSIQPSSWSESAEQLKTLLSELASSS
ncbi:glycosyltransferase family 4 protein [Paraburkholderia atlantica]|uniref:glycosyltransferase family 4 protein n=1 Tax=Paraburkholderia atlantica TaxID=2654982 RepID=UPI003D1C9DB4